MLKTSRLALALCACLIPLRSIAADPPIVDEPLGARYSLGMTLWHMGHDVEMIGKFHQFLADRGLLGDLIARQARVPETTEAVLVEPELLPEEQRGGWVASGEYLTSGATDAGPTVSFPLRIPRDGLYRLWVQYRGWTTGTAVTSLRLYPADALQDAPLVDDEVYDYACEQDGPAWHDTLVDLKAGDYVVKLGHVTRWWHAGKGPAGYLPRHIDCLYLTRRLWADPPDAGQRRAIRGTAGPEGIQWSRQEPLAAEDVEQWQRWQVRPVSWEQADELPELFALSREFWREEVDALAAEGYDEAEVPDYRDPRRQVIFDERWNMVANPVRIARQVAALRADLRAEPTEDVYYWVNAGEFSEVTGGWERQGTNLAATYSDFSGEASHRIAVDKAGTYRLWVRFRNINYHAPWRLTATAPSGERVQFDRDQQSYPLDAGAQATWQTVGDLKLEAGQAAELLIVPLPFRQPGTYRGIYSVLLTTDLSYEPRGSVKPAVTKEQYLSRAATLGAAEDDEYLLWTPPDRFTPLAQESWPDDLEQRQPPDAAGRHHVALPREATLGLPLYLRSLSDQPTPLQVACGPLVGEAGSFDGKLSWRVMAFCPYGPERQQWSPFMLLRRPDLTLPPWNVAGLWVTLDSRGVPPGQYTGSITLRAKGLPERRANLTVRVSPVAVAAQSPVLVGGWTAPPEGEAYLRDYREHGMNVWYSPLTKPEMERRGMKLLALPTWSATVEGIGEQIAQLRAGGLDYEDFIFTIRDEPSGETEESLAEYLDVARVIREADPQARVSFNPGEAASLKTFELLDPLCDFWLPYTIHRSYPPAQAAAKREIFTVKPWMWYTTPCLWDKSPALPGQLYDQIRSVPAQPGRCVGTAFFAFYYPFRDPWDTAYEHIADVAVTVLPSRHGPIATRAWEAIGEAAVHANLAVMVREKAGAATTDELEDPELQRLVSEGTVEELLGWLEANP